MFKQAIFIFFLTICMIVQTAAQEALPLRSDITFEVLTDSLQRNNSPQDLTLSVSSSAGEGIDYFTIKMNGTEVLWTVVSAEMDAQQLWLIMNEGKADRENILAWKYDQEEGTLRFYPPQGVTIFDLTMVLRANLLKSHIIQKKSEKEVVLLAQSGGDLSRCTSRGNGNKVSFK